MWCICKAQALLGLLSLIGLEVLSSAPADSVPMTVKNLAGEPVNIFWENTIVPQDAGKLVKQNQRPLRNSSDTQIFSFDSHQFVVRFLDSDQHDEEVRFTKGPEEESITIVYDSIKGLSVKQMTRKQELKEELKQATRTCDQSYASGTDAHRSCIDSAVVEKTIAVQDKMEMMRKYRNQISERLRNYTCADPELKTSAPIRSGKVRAEGKSYDMDVLFDTSHAKIWVMNDFITDKECGILENHGRPLLRRATVAAEDGSSILSTSRQAQQATYESHHFHDDDPLRALYQRILSVTNQYTNYSISSEGQEGYTIIQYNVNDQYRSHCDGACDGEPHVTGGRVATAVLYCSPAQGGGGTSFTNADIFVSPKKGQAAFFSYLGPDGKMDDGYTTHSGCPVTEGEKFITVVWMRIGVSKEEPWTTFDPSGVKILTGNEALPTDAGAEDEYQESCGGDVPAQSDGDHELSSRSETTGGYASESSAHELSSTDSSTGASDGNNGNWLTSKLSSMKKRLFNREA